MRAKNKSYHHGDLRAEILSRAPDLIIELGLDDFTLRELARRIGVTHPAVYRHFGDKRELLSELSTKGHQRLARHLRLCVSNGLETSLRKVSAGFLVWANDHTGHYQVMFGPRLNEDGKYPELESAIQATLDSVELLFHEFGFSRDRARDLCVGLMTQLHGFAELVRLRRIRVSSHEAAASYLQEVISPFISGVMKEAALLDSLDAKST